MVTRQFGQHFGQQGRIALDQGRTDHAANQAVSGGNQLPSLDHPGTGAGESCVNLAIGEALAIAAAGNLPDEPPTVEDIWR